MITKNFSNFSKFKKGNQSYNIQYFQFLVLKKKDLSSF